LDNWTIAQSNVKKAKAESIIYATGNTKSLGPKPSGWAINQIKRLANWGGAEIEVKKNRT
jgi:hypothetical protein